jgi:immunoglobulin-like protein involved in spore germination
MAAQLLKWSPNAPTSILSGGGAQDVDAVVQVKSPNPGGMSINITLSRLEGNTSNMWVVVGVASGNGLLTITSPVKGERLSSPVTLKGAGSAFEGEIGQAFVLDHLYSTIGQAKVTGASNGKTTYTTAVNYTSSFQGGVQEGIVVIYMYSQADGSIATAAMAKVMLG